MTQFAFLTVSASGWTLHTEKPKEQHVAVVLENGRVLGPELELTFLVDGKEMKVNPVEGVPDGTLVSWRAIYE